MLFRAPLVLLISYLNNFIVNLMMLSLFPFSFTLEDLVLSYVPGFYFVNVFVFREAITSFFLNEANSSNI